MPWTKEYVQELEERRKVFYLKLHALAHQIAEDFSWDAEDHHISLTYAGNLVGNYPWIYIEYRYQGRLTLQELNGIELRFRKFCEAEQASYQDTGVTGNQLQFKLIYREDLVKQKGPPGSPGGPQEA